MPTLMRYRSLALLACAMSLSCFAEEFASEDTQSLDGQVQEIKSDVLGIAAELDNLEERLLYPSGTQLALFVAFEEGEDVDLDAIEVAIDGEPATHHIYSFRELEALQKGGVQRIYMGNVPTGEHELSISISGTHEDGADFSISESVRFDKGVAPKTLGITLSGPGSGGGGIQVGDW